MIKGFIRYYMYFPYQALLITNLIWHVKFRPFRSHYRWENTFFALLTLIEVIYFLAIELLQCIANPQEYFSDETNLYNLIPLYTCAQSVVISLAYDEP